MNEHGWVTMFVDSVPEEEHEGCCSTSSRRAGWAVATETLVKRLEAEIAVETGSPGRTPPNRRPDAS